MEPVKFDPCELECPEMVRSPFSGGGLVPVFHSPISRRENFMLLLKGEKPLWMPHIKEFNRINPSCVPDAWARGMVTTGSPVTTEQLGGKDMFGVEWEYDPVSRGSMVRPGKPLVSDIGHWEDQVVFPDVDAWDWEKSAAETAHLRADDRMLQIPLMTGLFERLVSFMGMEDALVSLIDEDACEGVHRLMDRLCVLYDKILEKYAAYFQCDIVWFHDDWGSQRAPLFSLNVVREMLLPYLKRVVDSAHKYGIIFDMHSCGMIEPLLPAFAEAGIDFWDGQPMNDKVKCARLYGEHFFCSSAPELLPADAAPEEVEAGVRRFLEQVGDSRIYVGMHSGEHPLEYRYIYELSRKAYNS